MKFILFLYFFLGITAAFNPIEPNTPGNLAVLQEIFRAIFQPSATSTLTTHSIRGVIEKNFGYISRTGVNYVFATLGYTTEETRNVLEPLLHGGAHAPPKIEIRAKMSIKLRNRLYKCNNNPMCVVTMIEKHTCRPLPLTREYIARYHAEV